MFCCIATGSFGGDLALDVVKVPSTTAGAIKISFGVDAKFASDGCSDAYVIVFLLDCC